MVERRVTDPTRIAELLASEVTGLAVGPLAEASIVDAERDVEPGPDLPVAYRIAYQDDPVGRVRLSEDGVLIELDAVEDTERVRELVADRPNLALAAESASALTVRIETGAAAKPAVDALRAALDEVPGR